MTPVRCSPCMCMFFFKCQPCKRTAWARFAWLAFQNGPFSLIYSYYAAQQWLPTWQTENLEAGRSRCSHYTQASFAPIKLARATHPALLTTNSTRHDVRQWQVKPRCGGYAGCNYLLWTLIVPASIDRTLKKTYTYTDCTWQVSL